MKGPAGKKQSMGKRKKAVMNESQLSLQRSVSEAMSRHISYTPVTSAH